MKERIEAVLDKVRPALVADGGNVEYVDYASGVVKVKLTGACGGCPMATLTLKMAIEKSLKEQVPEVTKVLAV